ncbi:MAG: PilZ domain-containing protein [Candidatus Omnitrophota bacterium]
MLKPLVREERAKINEPCLWRHADQEEVFHGFIINESATGVLVETDQIHEIGQIICILVAFEGEALPNPSKMNAEAIFQHPLARKGKIVRLEEPHRIGVQFDKEENAGAEYRRWIRGDSCITTFFFPDKGAISLSGKINLETSALLQKIVNLEAKKRKEIILSCRDVREAFTAAITVFRTAVLTIAKSGADLTFINSGHAETAEKIGKTIEFEAGRCLNPQERYAIAPRDPIEILKSKQSLQPSGEKSQSAKPTPSSSKETPCKEAAPCALIVGKIPSAARRLAAPLERMNVPLRIVHREEEIVNAILQTNPVFIILDIDIETNHYVYLLNQIVKHEIPSLPPVCIVGPAILEKLVKEAIKLPLKFYMNKPFSERDYTLSLKCASLEGILSNFDLENEWDIRKL